MERVILTLCMITIVCIVAFAQEALFEKCGEADGAPTVYISHSMMRVMGDVKVGDKDISKVADRLDHLQTLPCKRPSPILSIKKSA